MKISKYPSLKSSLWHSLLPVHLLDACKICLLFLARFSALLDCLDLSSNGSVNMKNGDTSRSRRESLIQNHLLTTNSLTQEGINLSVDSVKIHCLCPSLLIPGLYQFTVGI